MTHQHQPRRVDWWLGSRWCGWQLNTEGVSTAKHSLIPSIAGRETGATWWTTDYNICEVDYPIIAEIHSSSRCHTIVLQSLYELLICPLLVCNGVDFWHWLSVSKMLSFRSRWRCISISFKNVLSTYDLWCFFLCCNGAISSCHPRCCSAQALLNLGLWVQCIRRSVQLMLLDWARTARRCVGMLWSQCGLEMWISGWYQWSISAYSNSFFLSQMTPCSYHLGLLMPKSFIWLHRIILT